MSDAMYLIYDVQKAGYWVRMYTPVDDIEYCCVIVKKSSGHDWEGLGETLPIAICKAWLLWNNGR
jgi:hypothetical protein